MSTEELSTTSYAILGLLSVKPWTTYELAKQMDRALGLFWPRARSHLYAEPKRLVALGLATAKRENTGQRPRTVYSITRKGRRALSTWVPEPGAGPTLEAELLVKVFFAEHGSRDDLLATLRSMRAWVEDHAVASGSPSQEYLEGRGAYPERLPWLVLVGRFLDEFESMVDRWAAWAIAEVEQWPEDLVGAEPDWAVLKEMAAHGAALSKRAQTRR
ncbi:MAG: hypothetical protein QOJ00_1954 [Actinomycetota bacterium]|jgi:DNA-binding PadR family transcriptional regulator